MEIQAISNQYIDKTVLSQVLWGLFGNNYEFEVQDEIFILRVPRRLTDDEIKQIQKNSNPKIGLGNTY
ncbi:uncharacterized protein BDR25DRAFT_301747 [Lindgomyces ingoldianus]|uniref:Uncharacterized protein n=1 Tax=Lindgomyces ingoldianus TaxID=673940 RepID=A0ACB6R551_9PLEO|nr:uncharacterized protein BDR25DRAFT_301747 [Lindgomyces ingoldianus]KAF2474369.1 hypothetical protein BDR25DRAFT_301747 [Lindgomyces ingoldianus]